MISNSNSLFSSSSDGFAVPSSQVLCQMYYEEFVEGGSLPTDDCKICGFKGARHTRRPHVSAVPSSLGSIPLDQLKSLSLGSTRSVDVPKWRTGEWKQAVPYLNRLEHLFIADSIPESRWPVLLLKGVTVSAEADWIAVNIVQKGLSWSEAKKMFTEHFQVQSWSKELLSQYQSCSQSKSETVQAYSDRFRQLCSQLQYADDDIHVINHFRRGLSSGAQTSLERQLLTVGIANSAEVESIEASLDSTIKLAVNLDNLYRTTSHMSSGYTPNSSHSSQSSHGKDKKGKYCSFHKTSSHNTSECHAIKKQGDEKSPQSKGHGHSSSSSYSGGSQSNRGQLHTKDGKLVVCKICQANHYPNDCPQKGKFGDYALRSKGPIGPSGSSSVPASAASSGNPQKPYSQKAMRVSFNDEKIPRETLGRHVTLRETCLPNVTLGRHVSQMSPMSPSCNPQSHSSGVSNTPVEYHLNEKSNSSILEEKSFVPPDEPKEVYIYLSSSNSYYRSLLDTGALVTAMDQKLHTALEIPLIPAVGGGMIHGAIASFTAPRYGSAEVSLEFLFPGSSKAPIKLENTLLEVFPIRTPHADYDFIIGRDLLPTLFPEGLPTAYYGHESYANPQSMVNVASTDISVVAPSSSPSTEEEAAEIYEDGEEPVRTTLSTASHLEAEYHFRRNQLMANLKEEIEANALIQGFCSLPQSIVRLDVDLSQLASLYRRQYKIPQRLKEMADPLIQGWKETGRIELAPPGCPFNNAITVVSKKDEFGQWTAVRACLDSRPLNKVLRNKDVFQLPNIRESFELFAGCTIFGAVDALWAFLQLEVEESSRNYLAFTWGGQQYRFVGAPFGLDFLTNHFQRVMKSLFSDMSFVLIYVDNLVWGSTSWEEHEIRSRAVINRLTSANVKIKPSSIQLGHSQMACLGHVISADGVSVDPSKIQAIQDWVLPQSPKDLQSFLGLCGFLRAHVRHYADVSSPLEAAKNQNPLIWTRPMIDSFNTLKYAFSKPCVLAHPDFSRPFHIATDASWTGAGGVLFQPKNDDEHITPHNIVAICSKKFNECRLRWPVYRKELFGIVYSLRQFHSYVYGRPDLVIHTDHKPLTYIFESKELSPALQQWLDVILDYTFKIVHRDGVLNHVPDALSRMYGEAYIQSPVWGVSPQLPTSPLPPISVKALSLGGERESSESSSSSISHESNFNSVPGHNLILTDDEKSLLLVEMERRGKTSPSTIEEQIQLVDQEHSFGHCGVEAIFRQLYHKGWWWPNMRSIINDQVKKCESCARFTVVKSGFHPAQSITALGPGDHFQVDTSVHLPESPEGHTTLLVCIDVFTGFIMLRALMNNEATTVADALWSIFSIIGLPRILQSDNGPEFTNDVLRCVVKLTGIEHRFISPYNPRADGKVERSIGTVTSIIKKMLHGTSHHWPHFVNFAQLSFNNKISSLTGSSPFSLMFGRSLNPIRDYTASPSDSPEFVPISLDDWKEHQEKILSIIYPAVSDRIKSGKDKMLHSLASKRKLLLPTSIPEGSTVMLKDPHRTNKFEPKYIGPYTIIRRARNGAYVLRDGTGDILDRHVPADQLKIIFKGKRQVNPEDEVFEINKILDHRGEPGHYEYLVRWKGYQEDQDSWEPQSSFQDFKVIESYWKIKRSDKS